MDRSSMIVVCVCCSEICCSVLSFAFLPVSFVNLVVLCFVMIVFPDYLDTYSYWFQTLELNLYRNDLLSLKPTQTLTKIGEKQ